jgi:hypothetical protein
MPTRITPQARQTRIAGQPAPPASVPVSQATPVGFPGPPGESAFQRALANGFVGTEAQWLASLAATAPKYRHDQTVPATTWTVNHALGFVPQVQVFSAGSVHLPFAAVTNPTLNQSVITFIAARSGFVLCR